MSEHRYIAADFVVVAAKSAGRTAYKSPLCPDSDQIPQRSEMTRWAKFGLMHCSKSLKQLIGTGSSDGGEVGLP